MKQLNAVTREGTRRRNMNCDTGNKTQVFHKARRQSCSEQDNMGSKPLRGIHVSLFARRRKRAANKETDVATCMCGGDVRSWLWRFFRKRVENTSFPWFEHEKPHKGIGLGHGATAACALECVYELPGTCFSIYMCWLVDSRGMREKLNGGDGWSGGSVTHSGLGFFFSPADGEYHDMKNLSRLVPCWMSESDRVQKPAASRALQGNNTIRRVPSYYHSRFGEWEKKKKKRKAANILRKTLLQRMEINSTLARLQCSRRS